MLKRLRSWISAGSPSEPGNEGIVQRDPPSAVHATGVPAFAIAPNQAVQNGFPALDWQAAQAWVDAIPDLEARPGAWTELERAWLEHLRSALGGAYTLRESDASALVSTLEPNVAEATLGFMAKTLQRVVRVLDGIAEVPAWGKDILLVFDDEETYYRYASQFYPDGEFAGSGGMYINAGCGHFVTVKSDLRAIEPTIVHEMTHGCLGHLPIPAWLNEGLAVNTEQRLCPVPPQRLTPHQMHAKHRRFWGDGEIQEFWSGKSFLRNDDANMLSYDLARILVAQLSAADWSSFRDFVLHADGDDAGSSAAAKHLDVELGALACALLEREPTTSWAPNPKAWSGAPERGAFSRSRPAARRARRGCPRTRRRPSGRGSATCRS